MTILDRSLKNNKIKSVEGNMVVTSLYTAGIGGEQFLRALKDKGQILGSHCKKCKKTFLPARLFCERCMSRLTDTRASSQEGRVHSVTTAHIDMDSNQLSKPITIGLVQFKGFEGGVVHYLKAKNGKKLRSGAKVKAVFRAQNKRTGSILDISHFETV